MIKLTIGHFREKLPALLAARASVLVAGEPGVGKDYNAYEIASLCGNAVMVNGGFEVDWKQLFPHRMPDGRLVLGTAMAACGWQLDDNGEPVQKHKVLGTLVISEVNRILPELKSQFQLLAADRAVEIPGATPPRRIKLDITFVSTANPDDLGVEEMPKAELDRYDMVLWLVPSADETARIVSKTMPPAEEKTVKTIFAKAEKAPAVKFEAGLIINEVVQDLAAKLDKRRFHRPEGLRLAKSMAAVLPLHIFSTQVAFRACAERCFPLGRQGSEAHRDEFNNIVGEVASTLSSKLAAHGVFLQSPQSEDTGAPIGLGPNALHVISARTLTELMSMVRNLPGDQLVSTDAVPLGRRAITLLPQLTGACGAGFAMRMARMQGVGTFNNGGVEVQGRPSAAARDGLHDTIKFTRVTPSMVMNFCSAVASRV